MAARLVVIMERPLLILHTASDERLVALAAKGDERAFAAIVARYRVPLQRYCRRFPGAAAADDAVQQSFINAHAALVGGRASTVSSVSWTRSSASSRVRVMPRAARRRESM